ncbi:MAG: MoaD/ThiS family protein [Proteobacteria bacterium]|nr:MoaD/ThiS family protein [Pseudomonadota bacterium]
MQVRVRYFASIREALGTGESVEVGPGTHVGGLRDALIARSPEHARVLARGRALRSALDHVLCDDAAVIADGAEVAFFPPVTGG